MKNQQISLRDYFAAKAMQGTLSNFEWMKLLQESEPEMSGLLVVALQSYEIADAMIAVSEETNQSEKK